MTLREQRSDDRRPTAGSEGRGAAGLFIVGLVVVLAVLVMLLGPTSTQQASNEPPVSGQSTPQNPPQPAQ